MRISGLIAVVLFFSSLYIHLYCDENNNVQQAAASLCDENDVTVFKEATVIEVNLGV